MAESKQIVHAFDVMEQDRLKSLPHTIALVGDDRFLKQRVLTKLFGSGPDADYERYSGSDHTWQDVADELATVSLFGSGPRHVVVNDADPFISRYRTELETRVEAGQVGVLVLDTKSLPSNTKLFKLISQSGWVVECRPPEVQKGKNKSPDVARMHRWLKEWSQRHHQLNLSDQAAELLVDLTGWEFGLLDQELAKLALFADGDRPLAAETVHEVVGGWRTQTTWEMLDAAADGDAAAALQQLDQLLQAGESPQALFGSIGWSLRRFAAATRIYESQEQRGGRPSLNDALLQAGFRRWPADALPRAAAQIKQLGRHRSADLYRKLLETDLALKGSHSGPQRARWAIEKLFLHMADERKTMASQQPPGEKPR